jgi:predicted NBD/HSP70 family sugar kinase
VSAFLVSLIARTAALFARPILVGATSRLSQFSNASCFLPVHVENDANAAALSELWYGPMDVWSAHCLLFILIVEGIGTGLILNGEVYAGSRVGMGGFGHITLDPAGPICSCGSIGCWEVLASDRATLARFKAETTTLGDH